MASHRARRRAIKRAAVLVRSVNPFARRRIGWERDPVARACFDRFYGPGAFDRFAARREG